METRLHGLRLAALAVAVVCMVPITGQAAPWLQHGYDAARTGATPDPGPAVPDVVFEIDLEASVAHAAPPLIFAGAVYVLTDEDVVTGTARGPAGVVRIDLSSGRVERVLELSGLPSGFASDGNFLFIGRDGGLDAYSMAGEAVWSWEHPRLLGTGETRTSCQEPAIREMRLYVVCFEFAPPPGEPTQPGTSAASSVVYAAKLDAATGQQRWQWTYNIDRGLDPRLPEAGLPVSRPAIWVYQPVVIGDSVVLTLEDSAGPSGTFEDRFIALGDADGQQRWMMRFGGPGERVPEPEQEVVRSSTATTSAPAIPSGTRDRAFLRLRDMVAVEPITGALLWSAAIDPGSVFAANGDVAVSGDRVFVSIGGELYMFDAQTGLARWAVPLPSIELWTAHDLVISNNALLGLSQIDNEHRTIQAVDADTGALLWRHEAGPASAFSVGDGVLAYVSQQGLVRVLGRTSASILPTAVVSSLYPAAGEDIAVDLGGSRAGVFGGPSSFRAEWGDGTVDDWQSGSRFNHTYATQGDRIARFLMRNDANQTASVEQIVHVGGTPPVELTAIQEALSPAQQERTFFVLGLLITLVVAAVGAVRLRRRRSILQHELLAIAQVYSVSRANPVQGEAALAERRARARGLLADGRIDASESAVLERRIDELAASLRLESIEDQFGFLSVSMARTLRDMLADGRIQRWERDHFIQALEQDTLLSPSQKERVRQRIEQWSERDAGGRA